MAKSGDFAELVILKSNCYETIYCIPGSGSKRKANFDEENCINDEKNNPASVFSDFFYIFS